MFRGLQLVVAQRSTLEAGGQTSNVANPKKHIISKEYYNMQCFQTKEKLRQEAAYDSAFPSYA